MNQGSHSNARLAQQSGPQGAGQSAEQAEAARKQAEAREEQRRLMLKQILTSEASERLANVALVKPEKAHQVENYVINAAQTGSLSGKITEDQLKDLLTQVTAQTKKETKVTIARRRQVFDSDDDDIDDDDF